MRRQTFENNLRQTIDDYRRQTGKEIDGETGVCSQVVLGALTGARMYFNRPPQSTGELKELERLHGLARADVYRGSGIIFDAVKALLDQTVIPFHGIIAEGRVETGKREPATAMHSVAVVADEEYRPIGIVDSTAPGMFRPAAGGSPEEDVRDVALSVQGRFLPRKPNLYLVLDEAGQEAIQRHRSVSIGGYVTINMIPPPR